jgi:hypothetical protein
MVSLSNGLRWRGQANDRFFCLSPRTKVADGGSMKTILACAVATTFATSSFCGWITVELHDGDVVILNTKYITKIVERFDGRNFINTLIDRSIGTSYMTNKRAAEILTMIKEAE